VITWIGGEGGEEERENKSGQTQGVDILQPGYPHLISRRLVRPSAMGAITVANLVAANGERALTGGAPFACSPDWCAWPRNPQIQTRHPAASASASRRQRGSACGVCRTTHSRGCRRRLALRVDAGCDLCAPSGSVCAPPLARAPSSPLRLGTRPWQNEGRAIAIARAWGHVAVIGRCAACAAQPLVAAERQWSPGSSRTTSSPPWRCEALGGRPHFISQQLAGPGRMVTGRVDTSMRAPVLVLLPRTTTQHVALLAHPRPEALLPPSPTRLRHLVVAAWSVTHKCTVAATLLHTHLIYTLHSRPN
jgi:hypothetical protein